MKLYDTIVEFKNISVGLDDPIYFYDNKEKIYTLDEISGIFDILRLDSDYLPVFYIYILIKDENSIIKEKRDLLLHRIGEKIGDMVVQAIMGTLQERISQMEGQTCVE